MWCGVCVRVLKKKERVRAMSVGIARYTGDFGQKESPIPLPISGILALCVGAFVSYSAAARRFSFRLLFRLLLRLPLAFWLVRRNRS